MAEEINHDSFASLVKTIIAEVKRKGNEISPIIQCALENKASMFFLFYKNWDAANNSDNRSDGGTKNTAVREMRETEESILDLCYKAGILKLDEQMGETKITHIFETVEDNAGTKDSP